MLVALENYQYILIFGESFTVYVLGNEAKEITLPVFNALERF
jgi:hypothetical protein